MIRTIHRRMGDVDREVTILINPSWDEMRDFVLTRPLTIRVVMWPFDIAMGDGSVVTHQDIIDAARGSIERVERLEQCKPMKGLEHHRMYLIMSNGQMIVEHYNGNHIEKVNDILKLLSDQNDH